MMQNLINYIFKFLNIDMHVYESNNKKEKEIYQNNVK
jgi:hypothetical protein